MYLEYWGLERFPFENVPDPEFMYYSAEHEEALARLLYGAQGNKGIVMITGEVGSGKTTLSKAFMRQINNGKFDVGLMANPTFEPMDFLKEILHQFGIPADTDSKSDILDLLNERMLENMMQDKITLLIIDEAQLIFRDTFEEIRLLLNFQLNDRFLLTLVLFGQPELRGIVKGVKQLNQRIAIRYHLNPLSFDETVQYIDFRVRTAGSTRDIFDQQAVDEIFKYSEGIPRLINNVCDMSLLAGFIAKTQIVDQLIVKKVIKDLS
jgi:general secretion pathway protein A